MPGTARGSRGGGRRGLGQHFDPTRLPLSDEHWRYCEFTDEERAEIEQIKAGALVEAYIKPGVFEWRAPKDKDEENTISSPTASQFRGCDGLQDPGRPGAWGRRPSDA
ncbi:hypothetical protein OG232_04270 [Streptomyces sp. NBC_01411]|uniref:hypothetical protein n=1 Tax=Streptomyces sp. NBC_01411 TaxID=2903857 RepID=UPI003243F898